MFLMTSSPLQAMEGFSDLPPVTPVGLLLFVSGLNVILTHLKPPKTVREREHALVCMTVCVRHTHTSIRVRNKELLKLLSKNESNFP